jgi:dTDP-4-dehydrorhamnose 3,5-epimerase
VAPQIEQMTVERTAIHDLWRISTKSVTDERGTVREFFRVSGFAECGLRVPDQWSQINLTWTAHGGVRGLHGESMSKLVGIAAGEAFGVYLDARSESPTYGAVETVSLQVGTQVLVPPGVCNGFQAVSPEGCQYLYCFDAEWQPGMAGIAVNPLDPALGIRWPIQIDRENPASVSVKDAHAPLFAEL